MSGGESAKNFVPTAQSRNTYPIAFLCSIVFVDPAEVNYLQDGLERHVIFRVLHSVDARNGVGGKGVHGHV